jgi:hypothetical protein
LWRRLIWCCRNRLRRITCPFAGDLELAAADTRLAFVVPPIKTIRTG